MMLWCGQGLSQEQESQTSLGGIGIFQDIIRFLAPVLVPKIMQDAYRLREYLRGEEFESVRLQRGDLYAVDEIFAKARELTWDNLYEALLISFLATLDHRRIGVQAPSVGSLLWFPLTSEFEDEFEDRVKALPRKVYPDSPGGEAGDRDKLQHFFGSAFLAYTFESRQAAERVGDAVELGEERFIVEGVLDERDVRANHHGQSFGLTLLRDTAARPSDVLQLVVAAAVSPRVVGDESMRSMPQVFPGICIPVAIWQQPQSEER